MKWLYLTGILLYRASIRLAALFNRRAKRWLSGRKGLFEKLGQAVSSQDQWIWFHCASLGEFEQGRPVIESIRETHPEYKILITFFSPSGFEVRKKYKGADYVCYLPLDTPGNARQFLEIVRPEMVFFIKYEFWLNFYSEIYRAGIPLFVISAIFRPQQIFFKWYGKWYKKILEKVTIIFVQDEFSAALLSANGIRHAVVSGDTRHDRVLSITKTAFHDERIEAFCSGHKTLIAGSTWQQDESLLLRWIKDAHQFAGMKYLIVPHEVETARINALMRLLPDHSVCYSRCSPRQAMQARVMVVDVIGKLSYVFRYAYVAYVGGGFGAGVHNVLEPAAFGLPVFFGPAYRKSKEARDMIVHGGAFSVADYAQLKERLEFILSDEMIWKMASEINKGYVYQHSGAVQIILNAVTDFITRTVHQHAI